MPSLPLCCQAGSENPAGSEGTTFFGSLGPHGIVNQVWLGRGSGSPSSSCSRARGLGVQPPFSPACCKCIHSCMLLLLLSHGFEGSSECVRLLIDVGANLEAHDCHFGTPLHVACAREHLDCVKVLLNAGRSVFRAQGGCVVFKPAVPRASALVFIPVRLSAGVSCFSLRLGAGVLVFVPAWLSADILLTCTERWPQAGHWNRTDQL